MKRFFFFPLLILTVVGLWARESRCHIIPAPLSIIEKPGEFTIDNHTAIVLSDKDPLVAEVAQNFAHLIKAATGLTIPLSATSNTKKTIDFHIQEGMSEEAYSLCVAKTAVHISASTPRGLFYGVQSLCQLLPVEIYGTRRHRHLKLRIPCCDIHDEPRFAYRGMMMDCCRHFMPKEFIKRFIDIMAMHKQNYFHWHLTDDQGWRIEIKKYPRLTTIGSKRPETTGYKGTPGDGTPHEGFYTQEDVKEIVEYARQRYVTIIPEIELPGHASAAIAAYPQLSCVPDSTYTIPTGWGIFKDILCPNAFTFQFLEDVFMELFSLFPSPYYHIGGDECPRDRWTHSLFCQDLKKILGYDDEGQLQALFVNRMAHFLRTHGKRVIGWDEIIDHCNSTSAIAMSYRGHAPAGRAFAQGNDVIMTPNRWCYFDYYQEDMEKEPKAQSLFLPLRKVYDYFPIQDTTRAAYYDYVKGVQGCLWSEFIPNTVHMEYMAFPRTLALAEVAWCTRETKDWDSFCKRMIKAFKRLDQKQIGYCRAFFHVTFHFNRKQTDPKDLSLTLDVPGSTIRYTTDGSRPHSGSSLYKGEILHVKAGDCIKARGYDAKGHPIGPIIEKIF